MPFWVKTVLLGQEVHYYMVYIAYFTELNSKIWDYAQKRKPAKSCHPEYIKGWSIPNVPKTARLLSSICSCHLMQLTRRDNGDTLPARLFVSEQLSEICRLFKPSISWKKQILCVCGDLWKMCLQHFLIISPQIFETWTEFFLNCITSLVTSH